ncbi:DUF6640 family protein [Nocardia sp. XZ_19_369]|uniref:DUF6640 family protein n=1 Tax=Nocardia sp. XZ_19_369 TaxID=2769487 RepID=UPI00188EAF00|nr:DUF6640 family protein [Nocardia sp. XZ_19_369]
MGGSPRFRPPKTMAGRWLLSIAAVGNAVLQWYDDYNSTHIFNPAFTAHAKFHDAITISLATILGGLALIYLWRPGYGQERLAAGALFAGVWWAGAACAFLFPGASHRDAQFAADVPHLFGMPIDLRTIVPVMIAVVALGYLLERRRLRTIRRTAPLPPR